MLSGASPAAVNDAFDVAVNGVLTAGAPGLLANDSDPEDDPLTAQLFSGPANGVLTFDSDGSFTYTPNLDFAGFDSFAYQAHDGTSASGLAAVTIRVNGAAGAPVAEDDSFIADEDQTLIVNAAAGVLANDNGAGPLTALVQTPPANGSLTLSSDGSFEYTPDANFNGTDTFTYVADDGETESNLATVTITVDPVNDPPTAANDSYATPENSTLNVNAASGVLDNDTDIDGDPLEAVLVSPPSNGTLTLNPDGSFEYTPDADFNGTDGFSYIANDGIEDSNVAAVTIIVDPENDPPVAENDSYNTDEDVALTIPADGVLDNDTDIDGDPLEAVLVSPPSNGTLMLNSDGSFEYTPDPDFNGTDGFSYVANDGTEDSNVAAVTIIVDPTNDPPVAENDNYNTDEDTTLNVPADGVLDNDTDIDGDPLEAVLVSPPSNGTLTLNPDGSFEYTPDPDFNGTDGFSYVANDGIEDSNVAAVTIIVDPTNDPPVAENDNYNTDEDVALTIPADGVLDNDTDVDGDPLEAVLVSPPSNGTLTLNPDGSFEYTPDPDFNGTDGFSYVANDGTEDSNVAAVTIIVNATNEPPVAENDSYNTDEDTTLTVPADGVLDNDTDIDGDPLEAVLVAPPSNGALTLNPDGSFEYTPDLDFNGTDGFSYVANDGTEDSNVAAVTIIVDPENDPPVAVNDSFNTNEDTTLTVPADGVLNNDTDVDADTLEAVLVSPPSNGTLTLNPDGSFEYTPDADFNGTDGFSYIANDGIEDSNVAAVTIIVDPENDPPVAENDSYNTDEDTTLNVPADGVLDNDTDIDGDPLEAVLVAPPSNGALTLNSDGSFEYTPDPNFNGTDGFSYVANDGTEDSNVAAVTIIVNATNGPPVAENDSYNTDEDTTLTVPADGVLDNDTDIDGDPLEAVLVAPPSNGALTLNSDGSFDYTPDPDFNGTDGFSYVANDGQEDSNVAAVTIIVNPTNDAPTAENDNYNTDEDTTLNIPADGVLDNDTDIDADTLEAVLVSPPSNGALTLNSDGSFEYTPDPDFNGTDGFSYVANDGQEDSNVAAVTIIVDPANDPPVAENDSYDVDQDNSLTIPADGVLDNDTDIDGDPLDALLVAGPSNGSLTLNLDGSFEYTPDPGFNGTDGFSYVANDGTEDSNVAAVTINVLGPPNSAPVAVDDEYSVFEGRKLNVGPDFAVLVNDVDNDGDPLTALLVDLPDNGMLMLNADGTFSYLPNPGFQGVDTFLYAANDGAQNSAPAVVTINVDELIGPIIQTGGELIAVGGDGDDRINFFSSNENEVFVRINEDRFGPFPLPTRIVAFGLQGDDIITVAGHLSLPAELHGGLGDDYIAGGTENDLLIGGPGDDRLLGGEGHNELWGDGQMSFEATETDGDDRLRARDGDDFMFGGGGNDNLSSGEGNDYLDGGPGDDDLSGGLDDDLLRGSDGNDVLSGGFGNDILLGGTGDDEAHGRAGDDLVFAGIGVDRATGESGSDILLGGSTIYDDPGAANDAALLAILNQWTSGADFATRVANLQNGAGGVFLRLNVEALDDGELDELDGGLDPDWLLAFDDSVHLPTPEDLIEP